MRLKNHLVVKNYLLKMIGGHLPDDLVPSFITYKDSEIWHEREQQWSNFLVEDITIDGKLPSLNREKRGATIVRTKFLFNGVNTTSRLLLMRGRTVRKIVVVDCPFGRYVNSAILLWNYGETKPPRIPLIKVPGNNETVLYRDINKFYLPIENRNYIKKGGRFLFKQNRLIDTGTYGEDKYIVKPKAVDVVNTLANEVIETLGCLVSQNGLLTQAGEYYVIEKAYEVLQKRRELDVKFDFRNS